MNGAAPYGQIVSGNDGIQDNSFNEITLSNEDKKISQIILEFFLLLARKCASLIGVNITLISLNVVTLPIVILTPACLLTPMVVILTTCNILVIRVLFPDYFSSKGTTDPQFQPTIDFINSQKECCREKLELYIELINYIKTENKDFIFFDFVVENEEILSLENFLKKVSNHLGNQENTLFEDKKLELLLTREYNFYSRNRARILPVFQTLSFSWSLRSAASRIENEILPDLEKSEIEAKKWKHQPVLLKLNAENIKLKILNS